MNYPTKEQVVTANREQLARWYRFLPSPGQNHVGKTDFETILEDEVAIMKKIVERFTKMGGFTPELSKAIGWEN